MSLIPGSVDIISYHMFVEHMLDIDLVLLGSMDNHEKIKVNPQTPKVFHQPKTPKGWVPPPGFLPSRPNFLKIFLMGTFLGSKNPKEITKKFYLQNQGQTPFCMTVLIYD